ncbi:response regulator [Polaribacter sp.]|uniref:response regulator n=1 Tax=Polaribacter sp. TaxID=1920175 RepID=UPI0040470D93
MDDINNKEKSLLNISGKKILIVDDDMINRMLATFILKKYQVIISEAGNGEEAIQYLNNNSCDLVLMDIQMPILDGYQASKIIRQKLNLTIPIIALTGSDSKEELQNCFNAGMNDYLFKPINEEQFIQTISKWITKIND